MLHPSKPPAHSPLQHPCLWPVGEELRMSHVRVCFSALKIRMSAFLPVSSVPLALEFHALCCQAAHLVYGCFQRKQFFPNDIIFYHLGITPIASGMLHGRTPIRANHGMLILYETLLQSGVHDKIGCRSSTWSYVIYEHIFK